MSKESKAKYKELDAKNKEAQQTTMSTPERMAICLRVVDNCLYWLEEISEKRKAGGSGGCATALECALRTMGQLEHIDAAEENKTDLRMRFDNLPGI